ncbi:MAG: putative Fe-S cluster assembly protein SufT [Gammaproteobacteria bacterium]|nr:putative Fe-S cluster assembly protein SufT [Gammaproteobacteria bacterium]
MYHHNSEPVTLQRDCMATLIPDGYEIELPQGSIGYITQSLGGSFTVYVDGSLFRVAGVDADALGKEPLAPPELPDDFGDEDVEQVIWNQIKTCYDPEIPINVADLGLIYSCKIEKMEDGKRQVGIEMTLTAPGCGMGEILVEDVRSKVALVPTVGRVHVELVFDPPWDRSMMSEEAQLQTGMMY